MPQSFHTTRVCIAVLSALATCALSASYVEAQDNGRFYEPIYRVAHEEPSDQAPQMAARVSPPKVHAPFDLKQRTGEHPLMPALRVARQGLQNIDSNIQDYSAMLYKQERIDGVLGDEEVAYVKVRHQPFGVYMFFLKPNKGRECLYNDPLDGTIGKLVAMDCGWRRRIGKVELDPEGRLAMKGQKYPIMKLGIRKLTAELIDVASNDVQFGECEVRTAPSKINGREHPSKNENDSKQPGMIHTYRR